MNRSTAGKRMAGWCMGLLAACAVAGAAAQGVQATDPNAFVKNAVETVVKAARADPAARGGDIGATGKVVEREFLPYTDFARTTQLAVGPAWQQATPDQRNQLVSQFTRLLVRTYALQLTQIRDQDIGFSYKPAAVNGKGDDAVVATQVKSGADVLDVGYRLGRTAGGWRIYDIDMMGLWLIQLYQKQFAAALANGGIEGLVKYLADHNARFEK